MAITQAMCTSFKQDLLDGTVNFRATGGNSVYMALYTEPATPNLDAAATAYQTNGEVTGPGYTAAGQALGLVNPTTSGTTAYTDFSPDETWSSSTITVRGALIYNNDGPTNDAMAVLDFTSDKSSSSGDFTVVFPAADATNAIIRIA